MGEGETDAPVTCAAWTGYDIAGVQIVQVELALEDDWLRVNADSDEQNGDGRFEDFREPDNMVPWDGDLRGGTLSVTPTLPGRFRLSYDAAKIGMWYESEPDVWLKADPGQWTTTFTTGSTAVKVEGLDGSTTQGDIEIVPAFSPAEGVVISGNSVPFTVVKSEFMITFDDGPYRFAWNASNGHPTMNCPADATTTIVWAINTAGYVNGWPAKAAFFTVGSDGSERMPGDPVTMTEGVDGEGQYNGDLALMLHYNNHVVGNHTNTHDWFWLDDVPTVEAEIQACEDEVIAAQVPIVKVFRAPYLWDEPHVLEGAANKGYQIIWGKTYDDWEPGVTWIDIAADIIQHMTDVWNTEQEPGRKPLPNIVILHDPGPATSGYLVEIVDLVRNWGFVLVDFDRTRASPNPEYYTKPKVGE